MNSKIFCERKKIFKKNLKLYNSERNEIRNMIMQKNNKKVYLYPLIGIPFLITFSLGLSFFYIIKNKKVKKIN
jgi:hypothetical protein